MKNVDEPRPQELDAPLGRILQDPVQEESFPRMWRAIAARRHAPSPRLSFGRLAIVLVAMSLGTLFVFRTLVGERAPSTVAMNAPLLTKDGSQLAVIEAGERSSRVSAAFSDGSRIIVDPGTRVEPLAASGREVTLLLARGSADFEVKPGGPRRWRIEAGLAQVEVVGTRFSVTRANGGVRVVVEHGTVLVRSALLVDGVVKLEAGRSLEVRANSVDPSPVVAPPPSSTAAVEAVAPALAAPPPATSARPAAHRAAPGTGGGTVAAPAESSWREVARSSKHKEAYQLLGAEGIKRETARSSSSADLFALADVARLSGHAEAAVEPLERLLALYPQSTAAPLARVTLGRVQLGLGNTLRAAQAFEQALALGVPSGLEEDVMARLAEAHFKSGSRVAAARVVDNYERRFPNGRYRERLQRFK